MPSPVLSLLLATLASLEAPSSSKPACSFSTASLLTSTELLPDAAAELKERLEAEKGGPECTVYGGIRPETALEAASGRGSPAAVRLLLQAGASPNTWIGSSPPLAEALDTPDDQPRYEKVQNAAQCRRRPELAIPQWYEPPGQRSRPVRREVVLRPLIARCKPRYPDSQPNSRERHQCM